MTGKRKGSTGSVRRPVRPLSLIGGAALAAVVAAAPLPLTGSAAKAATVAAPLPAPPGQGVRDFYTGRHGAAFWMTGDYPSAAAQKLVQLLGSAGADGLDPARYNLPAINQALQKAAAGNGHAAREADELLSQAFVDYVSDLKNAPDAGMSFVEASLKPKAPTPMALLLMAASQPSLEQYVANMGWMSPLYTRLRTALATGNYKDAHQREVLWINMERARVLPGGSTKYVLVNPAEQRLYMYQDGKAVDSMKVVVGQRREDRNTPMFATYIRTADINPYWTVPPDLVGDDVAIHVLKQGLGYLQHSGYQVLSDWGSDPTIIDPKTIDWKAVYDGKVQIKVRQLPGPHNVLGTLMFNMPNPFGVYLHDTSQRDLLDKDVRLYSGGCIRLDNAQKLGEWLFGHPLDMNTDAPAFQVLLPTPIPVFVTYLTAVPDGDSIAYLDDVYGRDASQLAKLSVGEGGKTEAAMR